MEYCGGGDLGTFIKNLKTTNKFAEERFVWHILAQLVTALYRCHYGVDPPEVGSNMHPGAGVSETVRPQDFAP
jgi:NIMA (never in mitosis gene a)-related kinase 2